MLKWYYGMATRNMHAVEESMAGTTYNKAHYWGLTGGKNIGNECCS